MMKRSVELKIAVGIVLLHCDLVQNGRREVQYTTDLIALLPVAIRVDAIDIAAELYQETGAVLSHPVDSYLLTLEMLR